MDYPQVLQCPHSGLQVLVYESRRTTLKRQQKFPPKWQVLDLGREEREWLTGVLGDLQEEELDRDLAPIVVRVV